MLIQYLKAYPTCTEWLRFTSTSAKLQPWQTTILKQHGKIDVIAHNNSFCSLNCLVKILPGKLSSMGESPDKALNGDEN